MRPDSSAACVALAFARPGLAADDFSRILAASRIWTVPATAGRRP